MTSTALITPADGLLRAGVHDELRRRFVTGKVMPGTLLSTRSLAQELGVSQMPVREAVSRLAAEGAVEIRSKRRIVVPAMTEGRFRDLLRCRELLEPEAAAAAVKHIDPARLKRLRVVDDALGVALKSGDVEAYMERNFEFHFLIYRAQPRPTMTQLIETLWLQFGPYMRVVYGRFGTSGLVDQHQLAIKAISDGSATRLKRAILADIRDGMGLIGKSGFAPGA
ncbi:MAG: GntR family transcriptional regulator [Pseudomonadota bacterium]